MFFNVEQQQHQSVAGRQLIEQDLDHLGRACGIRFLETTFRYLAPPLVVTGHLSGMISLLPMPVADACCNTV